MRRVLLVIACASAALVHLCPAATAAECAMTEFTRHSGESDTRIYSAAAGTAAIYFTSDMDVNTDGSPRSYHPADPRGKTLAFNNMGNAITDLFDAAGHSILCGPRSGACFTTFIETFEAARDANYNPTGHPRFETRQIIPWEMDAQLGWAVPCTIKAGPLKGYFVSQTSMLADKSKPECDQGRYLDSFAYNAIVLPRGVRWASQGVVTDEGDLVVVRDLGSGRIAFAINGDRGPADAIGEGSIALTAELNGKQLTGTEPYSEIKLLALRRVQYVIFPKDDIRRIKGTTFSQADINAAGRALLESWGGVERLDACKALEH